MPVYEKVTGCFSWKEAKSSDRGKILIPQKMKQCGFQLGLVRGLFPLVQETSHKSPLSPRAFQSSDAKQNCTVRQRLPAPKRAGKRKGRGGHLHCPTALPLPCPHHPASVLPALQLTIHQPRVWYFVSWDEEQSGAGRMRWMTAMDQREGDLAVCSKERGNSAW